MMDMKWNSYKKRLHLALSLVQSVFVYEKILGNFFRVKFATPKMGKHNKNHKMVNSGQICPNTLNGRFE